MPDPVEAESFEHKITAELVGVLAEVLSNITDLREIIRELLSNACAKEVSAKQVAVSVYESSLGLSLSVEDDGIGMDYNTDRGNLGRLNRFLDLAYSAQAGLSADEFSYKGLGAKLLHNSRKAIIETSTGGKHYYRIIIEEPKKAIEIEKQVRMPKVIKVNEGRPKGTSIEALGYAGLPEISDEFQLENLEEYLRYFSVVGSTRARELPRILLRVKGKEKEVKTGFPFIVPSRTDDKRTFVLKEPLRLSKEGVAIETKGGATVDTKVNSLVERTGGTWFAWRGIPYFQIDGRHFERIVGIPRDFTRFVVECDHVRLNTARSDLAFGDRNVDTFIELVNEAARKIKEMDAFKEFYKEWNADSARKLEKSMEKAKADLKSSRFVLLDGKPLHAEPKNETDVAAILWKLEGAEKLPFYRFRTLRYAGSPRGIDLLVDLQESEESERFEMVFCEVENRFLSFYRHGHNPAQTKYCICWEYDRPGFPDAHVKPVDGKPWKILLTTGEHQITIYRISRFPGISIEAEKTKSSRGEI